MKILKVFIIVSIFSGIISIDCQTIPTLSKITDKCKPTMPPPKSFCGDVGTVAPYTGVDGSFDYHFQKTMYTSACADMNTMSDAEINAKLRVWWNLYKKKLTCDSIQFNVPNGSIIKYAISGRVTPFIDDVIYAKLDLNVVDESDDRTVLDYVRDEIKRQTDTSPNKKVLQEYYDKLRAAGAKHKSEL